MDTERIQLAILRAIRRQGYTQQGLARRAGLSPSALSRRLQGQTRWRLDELLDVLAALGLRLQVIGPRGDA